MTPEQRVAVLEDLLHKVRSRARAQGRPVSVPPSTQAFRRASSAAVPASSGSQSAAAISSVPQTIPEERRISLPSPVLLRAEFGASEEIALFRGAVSPSKPPRSFSECA